MLKGRDKDDSRPPGRGSNSIPVAELNRPD